MSSGVNFLTTSYSLPNSIKIGSLLIELFSKSSAVAETGDRGHNRHVPKKRGLLFPFRGAGELGPHLTQRRLGRSLPSYQVAH